MLLIWMLVPAHATLARDLSGNPPEPVSTITIENADSLLRLVDAARANGDYAGGLAGSRRLLAMRRAAPSTPSHEIIEADWLVKTFDRILGLPEADRDRLASVDHEIHERVSRVVRTYSDPTPDIWEKRLAVAREIFGMEHPEVLNALTDLGAYYFVNGRYEMAEPPCTEATAMCLRLFPRSYPEVATCLNNLGALHFYLGNLRRAEPLYLEGLSVMRATRGPHSPSTLDLLNNLGGLYATLGDLVAAERCFDDIRRVCVENHLGNSNSGYLRHHAQILQMKGDLGGAERLVRTAIHDLESANYGYGPDYALHFNTLSTIYKERGDLERADSLSRRSIEILSKEQQGAHPFMPRLYNGLAWIRIDRGDPEGAITLFEQARARNSRLHAPSHPEVVGNLTSLGQARILVGGESLEKAETTLADAAARYDEARLLVGRSTKRATQRLASPYPALASVQLLQGKEEAAWASVEGSLSRTLADLLLAADERHLTDAEEAREDSLKNLLSRLEADVENLKQPAAETAAPGSEAERNLDEAWTRLLAAQAAWTRHEQQVSDRHPLTEGHAWSRDRIQSVMEDRTAIVGWLDIEIGQAWNRTWGYVLCKGGPVHWVLLPSSKSSIEDYRKALHAASEWPVSVALGAKDRERAEALFVERILPLLPFLENVESLVVIPSGPMLGIPVEAFRDGNGQWLSDRFSVSYAPSGTIYGWLREKTLRRPAHVRSSALVLGDPIFARSPQPREPETPNSSMSGPKQPASRSEDLVPSGVPSTLTSVWQPDVLFRSAVTGNREALDGLPRLPRTRTEAAGVAACFWKHQLLLGSEASEQALNALARSGALADFDILHFATHALPDDAQPERSALVLSRDRLDDPVSEILSGGPFYDGLLTAGEIMRDWKLDADLVTLSGCRTGLGYRVPGEGYLGLAHAFFQAGSRSMLVSLWDVEDRATALLMHRFYENMTGSFEGARAGLRGRAMGKAEALREAKSWLRELPDDAGALPYAHPAFWSAFVLVGEP